MRPILAAAAAAAALAPLLPAAPAAAHVTLDPPQAQAGATLRAAFRVPHGCAGGAATEQLVVTLPEGIVQARPMPKAGWAISVVQAPLEAPVDNGHGGVHTHRVAEIAWTGGPLPDAHYEEFVVLLRLPPADRAGEALWIPRRAALRGRRHRRLDRGAGAGPPRHGHPPPGAGDPPAAAPHPARRRPIECAPSSSPPP
jgi:periplasmic copper chaperone A